MQITMEWAIIGLLAVVFMLLVFFSTSQAGAGLDPLREFFKLFGLDIGGGNELPEEVNILQSGNLAIKEFRMDGRDLLASGKISTVYGTEGSSKLNFTIEYPNGDFTYALESTVMKREANRWVERTKEILTSGQAENETYKYNIPWTVTADVNGLKLTARDLSNPNVYAERFIPVEAKLPKDYESGTPIRDGEFKAGVYEARKDSIFYVFGIRFDWRKKGGRTMSTADYKIKVTDYDYREGHGDNWAVWVYDVYPAENEWHELDCSQWDPSLELDPGDLRDSLTGTLEASCTWS